MSMENAKKLLEKMGNIFLITFKEDGMPDARAVSAVKADGFKTIRMLSHASAVKTKEIERDPRCMIYATAMDDDADYAELRLWGRTEILSGREEIDAVWNDAYAAYFPRGKDDPEVRVLKFTTESGQLGTLEGPVALEL